MHGNAIFTDKEIRFLRELTRNRVPFIIVGLSAAALQGAPVVTQDIDLWFKDVDDAGIRKALKAVDGAYVPSIGLNPPAFAGDHVDLFDIVLTMHGLGDFDHELVDTIEVPLGSCKVRVLSLERIIKSKTAANREKDRRVLRVLKDALIACGRSRRRVRRARRKGRARRPLRTHEPRPEARQR